MHDTVVEKESAAGAPGFFNLLCHDVRCLTVSAALPTPIIVNKM